MIAAPPPCPDWAVDKDALPGLAAGDVLQVLGPPDRDQDKPLPRMVVIRADHGLALLEALKPPGFGHYWDFKGVAKKGELLPTDRGRLTILGVAKRRLTVGPGPTGADGGDADAGR